MKKLFTLFLFTAIAYLPLSAQLPDGIAAPNFTATDINGTTWTLYDLLDQGKSAVLFFGTTWSYNTWEYHQGGRMNQLWEQYGPGGTGEMVPFFIEVDDVTDAADLNGTGTDTYGDFVTGTPYPILDSANWIGELYALDDVPRVYHICPNRILTNAFDFPVIQFDLVHDNCLLPVGTNNAGLLRYVDPPREFCGQVTFSPNVRFQNLGTAPMSNVALELWINGTLAETRTWTGNAALYQIAGTIFSPVAITNTSVVEVKIVGVNGQPDDDTSNDALPTTITEGPVIGSNNLVVEIKTDYYPREIYWQVVDAAGTVFHEGGNPGIFVGESWAGSYTEQETVYQHEVALPSDGCYEFVIYDQYDDGICCGEGLGYYRLQDDNNFIYLQGGLFSVPEHRPFSLSGAATINNNAAIRGYRGPRGDFCGGASIVPRLTVQNMGANTINSLGINILDGSNIVQSFEWGGILAAGLTDTFDLDPVALDATTELRFVIASANQQPDTFFYQNELEVGFTRRLAQTPSLSLEFATDEWGYENYWQITNSAGDLIASGSNQTIGPNGGGLQVAQEDDPGSYPPFSIITESINLPADVTDCYTFLFVDDWADGINDPGYIKLTDNLGNLLFNFRPRSTGDTYLIDGQFGPSAVGEPSQEALLTLTPNPVTALLSVGFFVEKTGPLRLEVLNALGSRVAIIAEGHLPGGQQNQTLDVSGWGGGIYFLKMTGEDGEAVVRRFVVAGK